MDKQSVIVDNFIDAIADIVFKNNFGIRYTKDGTYYPIYFEALRDNIYIVDPDAKIKFGMSKFVIISSKLNNVIKVPFFGIYDYCYNRSIKDIDFEDDNGDQYIYSSFITNYCQEEYEKYCDLWEQNLDCFVAKTHQYKKDNIEVYLQEKIRPNNNYINSRIPSAASRQTVSKWVQEDKACIDNDWLATCIDIYGESKTERFLDYCNNEDPDIIDDLHDGNIGYRFNGTPAILDYTGFRD